jgi:hypothetical protein
VAKGVKSLTKAARFVIREENTERIEMEASFLKTLIRKCSLMDVATCCKPQLIHKGPKAQQLYLLDELLNTVDLPLSSSEESDATSTEETEVSSESSFDVVTWVQETEPRPPKVLRPKPSVSSSSSGSSVYRRVVGLKNKTDQEILLDLAIRIKLDLGLPCKQELDQLRSARNARFLHKLRSSRRFDPLPEELFIKIQVIKPGNSPVLVDIRIVVVPYSDHFVLKRLPLPRPKVFRTTTERIESLQASDWNHKIYKFVISKLKQSLRGVDLLRLTRQPLNRTNLLKNLDTDMYTFMDPVRTVILVVQPQKEIETENNKWRWLSPTTKRQFPLENIPLPHEHTFETEGVTIASLAHRHHEEEEIIRLLCDPSDILYHRDSPQTMEPFPVVSRKVPSAVPSLRNSTVRPNVRVESVDNEGEVERRGSSQFAGKYGINYQLLNESYLNKQRKEFLTQELKHTGVLLTTETVSNLPSVRQLTSDDFESRRRELEDQEPSTYFLKDQPSAQVSMSSQSLAVIPSLSNLKASISSGASRLRVTASKSPISNRMSVLPVWSKGQDRFRVSFVQGKKVK